MEITASVWISCPRGRTFASTQSWSLCIKTWPCRRLPQCNAACLLLVSANVRTGCYGHADVNTSDQMQCYCNPDLMPAVLIKSDWLSSFKLAESICLLLELCSSCCLQADIQGLPSPCMFFCPATYQGSCFGHVHLGLLSLIASRLVSMIVLSSAG